MWTAPLDYSDLAEGRLAEAPGKSCGPSLMAGHSEASLGYGTWRLAGGAREEEFPRLQNSSWAWRTHGHY